LAASQKKLAPEAKRACPGHGPPSGSPRWQAWKTFFSHPTEWTAMEEIHEARREQTARNGTKGKRAGVRWGDHRKNLNLGEACLSSTLDIRLLNPDTPSRSEKSRKLFAINGLTTSVGSGNCSNLSAQQRTVGVALRNQSGHDSTCIGGGIPRARKCAWAAILLLRK